MKSYLDCWIPAFIAFPTILFARRSRVEIIAFTHPWCQCGQRRPCLPWKTKAWRANEWKGPAGHFSWVGHYQQALLSYAVKSFALGQSLCSPGFYAGLPSSLKVFGLWNSTTRRNEEKNYENSYIKIKKMPICCPQGRGKLSQLSLSNHYVVLD